MNDPELSPETKALIDEGLEQARNGQLTDGPDLDADAALFQDEE